MATFRDLFGFRGFSLEPDDQHKCLILLIENNGDPGRIRTCDPQIRNLVLYPAELRAHTASPLGKHVQACNQLSSSGGATGNGKGATATPSSINSLASSGVALP